MSSLDLGETGTTCSGMDFRQFFEQTDGKEIALPDSPPALGYTASWVRDTSFEIIPDTNNTPPPSESDTSDLPSIAGSCEPPKKRSRIKPPGFAASMEFFKVLERAKREVKQIRSGIASTAKWRILMGICVEEDDTVTSDSKPQYDELMALFKTNVNYNSISFENSYRFDWNQYNQNRMQYVIFTKICTAHPPEMHVEMTKEETKCLECSGTELSLAVRLTIPLDLNEIAIPLNEDVAIHVAFLPKQLPNFSVDSNDFHPETIQKMYDHYQNVLRGRVSKEYEQWIERAKLFVKNSMGWKSMRLFHGRVARRKLENRGILKKRRCFIFADVFEIE